MADTVRFAHKHTDITVHTIDRKTVTICRNTIVRVRDREARADAHTAQQHSIRLDRTYVNRWARFDAQQHAMSRRGGSFLNWWRDNVN